LKDFSPLKTLLSERDGLSYEFINEQQILLKTFLDFSERSLSIFVSMLSREGEGTTRNTGKGAVLSRGCWT